MTIGVYATSIENMTLFERVPKAGDFTHLYIEDVENDVVMITPAPEVRDELWSNVLDLFIDSIEYDLISVYKSM